MIVLNKSLKGKCIKQTTIAIIVMNGKHYIGTNWCENPQIECPRKDKPSGVGYELCKDICKQRGHAEENAVNNALREHHSLKGATMFLLGHYYVCDECKKICKNVNMDNIIILDDLICKKRIVNN